MTSYLLECCVDSTESALEAARGGADRLELCTGLVIGGVTPGPALFEEIRAQCDLPIRVLLRPRFGDFLYTAHEISVMAREAEMFGRMGAEGIVIGCLQKDGSLHMEQMRELMAAACGMKTTLHRAFDLCADPFETYERAAELGIDTILTSGQEKDALSGLSLLKRLGELAQEKEASRTGKDIQGCLEAPAIMAGAGVTPDVIRQLLSRTGITRFHLSAKKILESGMEFRRQGVPMGIPGMDEYSIFRTDADVVARARAAVEEAAGRRERL